MRTALLGFLLATAVLAKDPATTAGLPEFKWVNYTTKDGLPDNKVFNVKVDGNRVWAGTENGLAVFENGKWKSYGVKDGLVHRAVLYLDVDKTTHDLWIATMGGASRLSGGRFDNFTQLNSGLANDIVYGVAVKDGYAWFATAAGSSRFDLKTNQWAEFHERNTPMYEIWTYAVSPGSEKVYYAVWGGGLLEYDIKGDRWKSYDDPDGETEMVLFKDQGLIHEITTSVSWAEEDKVVWVGTYFGASRYDGRNWHNFLEKDSGLPSNFLNQVKAPDGTRCWFSTDKGLAYYDGESWAVYRPSLDGGKPEMIVRDAAGKVSERKVETAPPHNYIFGMDFQGDDIWVATARGVSHGIRVR
jgi:ligand-binding sensor domain-containing protein